MLFRLPEIPRLAALLVALALCAACGSPSRAGPLSWSEVERMPLPEPGQKITYGSAPQQFGELRLPPGAGPFPVAVILHGGCWLREFDYVYMTRLAARLTQTLGLATWTPEFRRIGDPGGGWPGTLLDAASATDHLRELARQHPLDLQRVLGIGHSAGGHLALWLAARPRLPPDSELYRPDPLPLRGVIGLAAIGDLLAYRVGERGSCNSAVDELVGGPPTRFPRRYSQASPMQRLPLGVPQWLVQGGLDPIVPAGSTQAYATAAKKAGDRVEVLLQAGAGHFDPAVPDSLSWPAVEAAVKAALQ